MLLKSYDERGFVFYINHEGRKGRELEEAGDCRPGWQGQTDTAYPTEASLSRFQAVGTEVYEDDPKATSLWRRRKAATTAEAKVLGRSLRKTKGEIGGRVCSPRYEPQNRCQEIPPLVQRLKK